MSNSEDLRLSMETRGADVFDVSKYCKKYTVHAHLLEGRLLP